MIELAAQKTSLGQKYKFRTTQDNPVMYVVVCQDPASGYRHIHK